ncbi:hypothetical protein DL765_008919 [Monosporascus sp. GIB2]|nr:hypothetical protein DL765_008919 [Monosporascus sp. GIB2]
MEAIWEQPALDPPPGVEPNFANPGGNHALGYGIVISSSIISTIAVLARLVSSATAKKFVIEDLLMVAALNIHLGAVFYGPTALCIKVAILVNWLRIFVPRGTRNSTFWILHTLIWTNIIFYVITTFTEIFRCWPREKIWNPWFEGGSCPLDIEGQNIATSVLNFISDTTILAMPQWVIWKLQMSTSKKWGLSLLFVIGIGAWAFGVVRTVYFVKLLSDPDVVYVMTGVGIWSIWEVTTGFLIMGIPAFPRVAKSLPMSESVASFFRSLVRSSQQSLSRSAVPQWRFNKSTPRKRRGLWEISELETHGMVSIRSSRGDEDAFREVHPDFAANKGDHLSAQHQYVPVDDPCNRVHGDPSHSSDLAYLPMSQMNANTLQTV